MQNKQFEKSLGYHYLGVILIIITALLFSHILITLSTDFEELTPIGINRTSAATEADEISENSITITRITNTNSSSNSEGSEADYVQYPKTSDAYSSESQKPHLFVKELIEDNKIFFQDNTYPVRSYSTSVPSTDPLAGQWWETELGLPNVWDSTTGSSETVIAIIDTAFALNHQDLDGRWYQNSGESGPTTLENPSQQNCTDQSLTIDRSCNLIDDDFDGIVDNESGATSLENPSQFNCSDQLIALDKKCNLIDDDGNGLVDDWRGWDFINFDRSVYPGETNPSGSGTRHGTYVSSVAAASGENGVGIAGANWQARILPIQAIDDDGYGNSVSVARAIRYAVYQGADVINLSLGGDYPDSFLLQTIREAMQAGVIVVAASGNDGCDCVSYPANYPEVVAVGALNESRDRASFSSYGTNLDVLAPGTNMTAASWSSTNQTTLYVAGINGTSLATPLVSASLALLKEQLPSASTTELVAILTETSDALAIPYTDVRSSQLGYGTVQLAAAINRTTTPLNVQNIIGYQNLSHGDSLSTTALDADRNITIYECDATIASTPVYRLQKSDKIIYSASLTEYAAALQSGYTSKLFTYVCVFQPHDTSLAVRALNLTIEFENKLNKK